MESNVSNGIANLTSDFAAPIEEGTASHISDGNPTNLGHELALNFEDELESNVSNGIANLTNDFAVPIEEETASQILDGNPTNLGHELVLNFKDELKSNVSNGIANLDDLAIWVEAMTKSILDQYSSVLLRDLDRQIILKNTRELARVANASPKHHASGEVNSCFQPCDRDINAAPLLVSGMVVNLAVK